MNVVRTFCATGIRQGSQCRCPDAPIKPISYHRGKPETNRNLDPGSEPDGHSTIPPQSRPIEKMSPLILGGEEPLHAIGATRSSSRCNKRSSTHSQRHERARPFVAIVGRTYHARRVQQHHPQQEHDAQPGGGHTPCPWQLDSSSGSNEGDSGEVRQEQVDRYPWRNQGRDELGKLEVLNPENHHGEGKKEPPAQQNPVRLVTGFLPAATYSGAGGQHKRRTTQGQGFQRPRARYPIVQDV